MERQMFSVIPKVKLRLLDTIEAWVMNCFERQTYANHSGNCGMTMQLVKAEELSLDVAGANFIKSWEQCRLVAYRDAGGIWTIGWGHTRAVYPRDVCTQAQADAWFDQDVAEAVAAVRKAIVEPITQSMFNALVSFAYNCGVGAFERSTLIRHVNVGWWNMVAQDFRGWSYIGKVWSSGLARRRIAEAQMFMSGV